MKTIALAPKKAGRPRKTQTSPRLSNQITVHLPPDLVAALDGAMAAQGMRSRSELIREACQSYLQQKKQDAQALSMTHRMRSLSPEERRAAMTRAAAALTDYYRTDPEIAELHTWDGEKVFDVAE